VGYTVSKKRIRDMFFSTTVMDKIKEVVLEVDVSGRCVDFTTTAVPAVYDMNGDKIASSKLTMQVDSDAVTVNVPILASKEMKIRVTTVGELEEGYELLAENIAYQPEAVRVAGSKEDLDKLGYFLDLEVDVTGQTGVIEKNVQIESVLDDTLTSLRVVDAQMMAVTVTITPYVEREVVIPMSEIDLWNLGDGLTAELLQKEDIQVNLKCKNARAPLLTIDYLNPYVDMSGLTEGTYKLPLSLELPSKVIWGEEVELDVVVKRKTP